MAAHVTNDKHSSGHVEEILPIGYTHVGQSDAVNKIIIFIHKGRVGLLSTLGKFGLDKATNSLMEKLFENWTPAHYIKDPSWFFGSVGMVAAKVAGSTLLNSIAVPKALERARHNYSGTQLEKAVTWIKEGSAFVITTIGTGILSDKFVEEVFPEYNIEHVSPSMNPPPGAFRQIGAYTTYAFLLISIATVAFAVLNIATRGNKEKKEV